MMARAPPRSLADPAAMSASDLRPSVSRGLLGLAAAGCSGGGGDGVSSQLSS